MMAASAPGKLILFGEHAVVFGEPALSTAINLRAEVYARPHTEWLVDGASLEESRFRYVKAAVAKAKPDGPLWIEIHSMVPSVAGLGSPAAAAEAVRQIGEITLDGVRALQRKDLVAAGKLMDRNHTILTDLGVGHPSLDRLVEAARPSSYGAKLTGAGGGGSIVALTDRPSVTAEAIRAAGGKAFIVQSDSLGVAKLG